MQRLALQATQNSILSYEKANPDSTTYHRSAVVEINGNVDKKLLQRAINFVIARHPMLRVRLADDNDQPTFETMDKHNLPISNTWPLQHIKATSHHTSPPENLYQLLRDIGEQGFIEQPFNFNEEPMWRAMLIDLGSNKYQFAMLFHHLIVDEMSIGIVLEDISEVYNALKQHRTPNLSDINDVETLVKPLPDDEQTKRRVYWTDQLKDLNTVTIQSDQPAAKSFTFNGKRIPFQIDTTLVNQLQAAIPGVSLNNIFMATLYTLLLRYTGESDITIGITSANRRQRHLAADNVMARLVNAYFNSIPIRMRGNTTLTFRECATHIKPVMKAGLQNQLPHHDLFHHALPKETRASLNTASPFNFMLVTNEIKPTLTLAGTTSSRLMELDLGHCKFENFGFNFDKLEDGSFEAFVEYNLQQYSARFIQQIIAHFQNILRFIANHPDVQLTEIPILTPHEMELINAFNNTDKPPVFTGNIADFIHQTAISAPKDQRAFVFHGENTTASITYHELEETSNQVAAYIEKTDNNSTPIAICMSRSLGLVATVTTLLKTGRPFILIDPNDTESVEQKLNSVNATTVFIDNTSKRLFTDTSINIINLDDYEQVSAITACNKRYYRPEIDGDDTAYIMRTSGSTSEPKMVACPHSALMNLLNALMCDFAHKPHTKILSTAPATFDAFIYDILLAVVTTGEVHLTDSQHRLNPQKIEAILTEEDIDFTAMTADMLSRINTNAHFKRVISMGGAPSQAMMSDLYKHGVIIENDYGTTEGGIQDTAYQFNDAHRHTFIGKPIRNMQAWILDAAGNVCPPNVPGELHLAGAGLATGYLDNPELTDQKFIYMVFNGETNRFEHCANNHHNAIRLYKTGDYCEYVKTDDEQLMIKFLHRCDSILKIHGVRVDLNEVRDTIRRHPLVKDAIILTNDERNTLFAYILPTKHVPLDELRSQLQAFLPTTNIPAAAYPRAIHKLASIPFNTNGKIDKSKLPIPSLPKHKPISTTATAQQVLAQIFCQVVGVADPSAIEADRTLHDLGADSIYLVDFAHALNHSSRVRNIFGINDNKQIGVGVILPHTTIASLEKSLYQLGSTTTFSPRLHSPQQSHHSGNSAAAAMPASSKNR